MILSVADVAGMFDDLISEAKTRSEVSAWASDALLLDDHEELQFEPPLAEPHLRSAVHYLLGADLKEGRNRFLHTTEDFRLFLAEWKQGLVGYPQP